MRYRTGGYTWHSRLLYWWWWVAMGVAVFGSFLAAVKHADPLVWSWLIGFALAALTSYLSDRYILGRFPTLEERRSGDG